MTWETAWVIWLAVTAVSFVVLETVALVKGETLSEVTRRWLGVDPPKPWRRLTIGLFASLVTALAEWFVPHIVG